MSRENRNGTRTRAGMAEERMRNTVERILTAAEEGFARAGFDRARLEDIAERAGIRRPSLLYHFRTKRQLHDHVVERAFDRLEESLRAALSGPAPFAKKVAAASGAFERFLEKFPWFAPIVLRELMDADSRRQSRFMEKISPMLDRLEKFARTEGGGWIPEDFPVRSAIMMIVSSALLYAAAGPLRGTLWGAAAGSGLAELVTALVRGAASSDEPGPEGRS